MEQVFTINVLFTDEARAQIPNVAYKLPPIRNSVALPERGDVITLAGLESFMFAVVGRRWAYLATGAATLDLVLDLLPASDQSRAPLLALVQPTTGTAPAG